MPKLDPAVARLLRDQRKRGGPSIDGSYVFFCKAPFPLLTAVAHPAYTPDQIEAERKAKGMGIAQHVYYLRDEQMPAPYWLSPPRMRDVPMQAETANGVHRITIRHQIIDVARSRDDRRSGVEVAIPLPHLLAMKSQNERNAYVLDYIRKAIAAVIESQPAAA